MKNAPLFLLAIAMLVWNGLTIYISTEVMGSSVATKDDYNYAIACIVGALVFFFAFSLYAYHRGDVGITSGLTGGFRWYDALVLFLLLTWVGMSIAISSMMINYHDKEQILRNEPISTAPRDVAIANIVLAILIFLLYVLYLMVQDRIPQWCGAYSKVQKQRAELYATLAGFKPEKESRTSANVPAFNVILPQNLAIQQKAKKDSLGFSLDDGE